MKGYWTQPSLSRDFALLAAAVLFVLFLISAWVTFTTYTHHSEQVSRELAKESQRIEGTLASEMQNANYLLTALGRQLVLDETRDPTRLAQMLKAFDNKGFIYTILAWVNTDQQLIVSSNKGILEKPVDLSDRDYVKKAASEPWKMQIGRPIEGRVSGRWVIPLSMGITDYTGKFIGTIMLSVDINTLTEQLSNLIKRDGISFAIVSKTLIPLTQVSDDKDFVTNNFPTQKLVNVNFSDNPSGLIAQGSLFWGTGSYSFYKVSTDYPYIILLGYDSRYSDEAARSVLFSRLLQMMVIAAFLVTLLWIMRIRMIKPVLDITALAAAVAKGEHHPAMQVKGPVEIEALAHQVLRIGEYISENKRIEDELRNKVFMLKKAKERAEMDRRSKSEFLAYVCQEMRTSLNNIIGFAQVMRDQLYGPIENRKYRQYSADIYQTGNTLLSHMQDVLTLSKIETGYVDLVEKPQDIASVINKVLRFIADKLQTEKLNIKLKLHDPLPRLVADEFRLQQMLMNLVLHALHHMLPEQALTLEARLISESKDKFYMVFLLYNNPEHLHSTAELLALADSLQDAAYRLHDHMYTASTSKQSDLSLELAKSLVTLHQGYIDIKYPGEGQVYIALFFPMSRIQLGDNAG